MTHPRIRPSRLCRALPNLLARVVPAVVVLGLVAGACGQDKTGNDMPGASIARNNGCIACHSTNGAVGVGPTWKGIYQSTVTLSSGATAVVDRDFLVRAIKDPAADIEAGAKVKMPVNHLSDADVQKIVDYIISLK
ncbi:MAG: cytochrome c [Actinomycetota bacterium]